MSAVFERLAQAIEREERAVLFTVIEGRRRRHMLVLESGERVGDATCRRSLHGRPTS